MEKKAFDNAHKKAIEDAIEQLISGGADSLTAIEAQFGLNFGEMDASKNEIAKALQRMRRNGRISFTGKPARWKTAKQCDKEFDRASVDRCVVVIGYDTSTGDAYVIKDALNGKTGFASYEHALKRIEAAKLKADIEFEFSRARGGDTGDDESEDP